MFQRNINVLKGVFKQDCVWSTIHPIQRGVVFRGRGKLLVSPCEGPTLTNPSQSTATPLEFISWLLTNKTLQQTADIRFRLTKAAKRREHAPSYGSHAFPKLQIWELRVRTTSRLQIKGQSKHRTQNHKPIKRQTYSWPNTALGPECPPNGPYWGCHVMTNPLGHLQLTCA